MKKITIFGAALCVALAFASCKSSESAYKKAYEKSKAQNNTSYTTSDYDTESNDVTNVPTFNGQEERRQGTNDTSYESEPVRREEVSVVNGAGLSVYSVVVGSFSVKSNAEGLQRRLINSGYQAQLAYNSQRNMYRVIATTFDSKASAVQSRNQLRSQFPDAWLLSR